MPFTRVSAGSRRRSPSSRRNSAAAAHSCLIGTRRPRRSTSALSIGGTEMPAKKTSTTKTSAKTKTPAKTQQTPKPVDDGTTSGGATAAGNIQVRMYRVGFGDCFLLTLPMADGPRYVLVDCGVHSKGNINVGGASMIGKAVDNIAQVTGKKLSVVIATHPHQDHISGFGSFAKQFGEFSIDEVWMPWTVDPNDPTAKSLHDKRSALVSRLQAHFAALG